MKHTPGPWSINHWSKGTGGVTCMAKENDITYYTGDAVEGRYLNVVAPTKYLGSSRTYGSFEGCHIAKIEIGYEGFEEAKANAKLIAAAPELLEICKHLVETLTNLGYKSGSIMEEAHKTIKKATV